MLGLGEPVQPIYWERQFMKERRGWILVVAIVVLLVGACAPQDLTTPAVEDRETPQAATAPTGETSSAASSDSPSSAEYPVDEDDWHVLGAPDAPVTMVDFSDFQ
jgi:hypothetical protein